jgi:hypothetical protein
MLLGRWIYCSAPAQIPEYSLQNVYFCSLKIDRAGRKVQLTTVGKFFLILLI